MANFPGKIATFAIDSSVWPQCVFSTVPIDSKLQGFSPLDQRMREPLAGGIYRYTYSFTPDKGGLYTMSTVSGNITVAVAEKLTRKLRAQANYREASATVVLFMDASTVISTAATDAGEITPRLDVDPRGDQAAKLAAKDPNVLSALHNLVGRTGTQVTNTYWPALAAAWTTACTTPTANPSEDAGAATLLSDGWTKEN